MAKNINNQKTVIQASRSNGSELFRICPHCKKEKPMSEFGYRNMGDEDNTIRNQSWCRDCRSKDS